MVLRTLIIEMFIALAAVAGFGAGYLLWDTQTNWYAADVSTLGPGPENDLIRYGHDLIVNTPRYIGRSAENPDMAFAGNDLSLPELPPEGWSAALRGALRLDGRLVSDDGRQSGAAAQSAHQ